MHSGLYCFRMYRVNGARELSKCITCVRCIQMLGSIGHIVLEARVPLACLSTEVQSGKTIAHSWSPL